MVRVLRTGLICGTVDVECVVAVPLAVKVTVSVCVLLVKTVLGGATALDTETEEMLDVTTGRGITVKVRTTVVDPNNGKMLPTAEVLDWSNMVDTLCPGTGSVKVRVV